MARKKSIGTSVVLAGMVVLLLLGKTNLKSSSSASDETENEILANEKVTAEQTEKTESQDSEIIDQDIYEEGDSSEMEDSEQTTQKAAQEEKIDDALREEEAMEAVNITNPAFEVDAKAAVLMNVKTQEIMYSKNALEEIQPASTAKLLTAIVAIEYSDEDEEFTVGDEIDLIASDSSRAYLCKGQILSLSQILDALLLPSGNDAAYVIATNLGRKIAGDASLKEEKAVDTFIEKMNEKANEIGVVHSSFQSPDGYDADGQYTTAYDMALIGAAAVTYDEILETVQKAKARDILLSGEDVTWNNSNKLVKQGSGYYYSYAIGLKTGSSGQAGRCLIAAAQKDDDIYVSVVMDSSYEGRWQDSVDLLRYAIGLE